jgi:hypothetical protein
MKEAGLRVRLFFCWRIGAIEHLGDTELVLGLSRVE